MNFPQAWVSSLIFPKQHFSFCFFLPAIRLFLAIDIHPSSPLARLAPRAPMQASTPSPTTIQTPTLSFPNTPQMDETPKTAVLRTPRAAFDGGEVRIEGSVSESERGSIDMGTVNGERKDKGKERAVESAEDEDEETSRFDMELLGRLQSRVNELEASGKTGDEWMQRNELLGIVGYQSFTLFKE